MNDILKRVEKARGDRATWESHWTEISEYVVPAYSDMFLSNGIITPGQKKAWEKLAKEFGDELCTLSGLCIQDCAEAGVQALIDEAEKLMQHEAVRKAYEQFMLVCELTKQQEQT